MSYDDTNNTIEFKVFKNGLHATEPGQKRQRVGPYLKVLSTASYENDDTVFVRLRFDSVTGARITKLLPRAELRKPLLIGEFLVNHGYDYPLDRKNRSLVLLYLAMAQPARHQVIVRRTGWVGDRFVLPDKIIGPDPLGVVYDGADSEHNRYFGQARTLKGWQNHIAIPAAASSRMMLAITLPLAGTLLRHTNVESGVLHIVGPSSSGKTTVLIVKRSVKGRAVRGELGSWDATAPGVEGMATEHNDLSAEFDEVALAGHDQQSIVQFTRKVAFKLSAGRGRILVKGHRKRLDCEWRLLALSSGEIGLSELPVADGLQRITGERLRLIDIPLGSKGQASIYDLEPLTAEEGARRSEAIERACATYYGRPLRVFLTKLTNDLEAGIRKVRKWMDEFYDMAGVPTTAGGGWERRFASRFALCYATGRLAIEYGVLPWDSSLVGRSIVSCYRDARGFLPDATAMLTQGLAELRRRVISPDILDLTKLDGEISTRRLEAAAGYVRATPKGMRFIAIKPDTFNRWFKTPGQSDLMLNHLVAQRALLVQDGRPGLRTKQVKIAGIPEKKHYICIRKSSLRKL
jgi:putative DNA primase/helicase